MVGRRRFNLLRRVERGPQKTAIPSMNNVRSLVQAARTSADPGANLYSDQMLAELLALNEEMVEQLRLETLGTIGDSTLLTGMIDQHEKAASMLRLQLAHHKAGRLGPGATAGPAKSLAKSHGSAGVIRAARADEAKPATNGHKVRP